MKYTQGNKKLGRRILSVFYMKGLETRTMENTKQEVKKGEVLQKNRYKRWSDKKYIKTDCKMKAKQIKEKNHRIKQEIASVQNKTWNKQ